MFPSSSSFPTRAAFAPPGPVPPVPRPHSSYAALRRLASFGLGYGSPRLRPTPMRALPFFSTPRAFPQANGMPGGLVTGAPSLSRIVSRRNETLPRFLGRPLRARRVHPPRRVSIPLAMAGRPTLAFRAVEPLGTRNNRIFEAGTTRLTRSRAYASPVASPRPSQGSLPAGRAHPSPCGDRTRWTTFEASWSHFIFQSSSTSIAWSHCMAFRQRGSPTCSR